MDVTLVIVAVVVTIGIVGLFLQGVALVKIERYHGGPNQIFGAEPEI